MVDGGQTACDRVVGHRDRSLQEQTAWRAQPLVDMLRSSWCAARARRRAARGLPCGSSGNRNGRLPARSSWPAWRCRRAGSGEGMDAVSSHASMRGDQEGFFDSDQCGRKLWSRQCFRVATRMIYVKARMAALLKMEGCGSPLRQLRSTAILNSPSSMRMGRTRWSFRAGASWAAGSRRRHAAASTCIPRIGVTGRHRLKRQLSLAAVRASREARSL